MPGRTPRSPIGFDSLMDEASLRLPLFEDLPADLLRQLSDAGFGRGFLTASLRARLRKAGIQDLGQLARSSPAAIGAVRKFGPIRVERARSFLLDEIARRLPAGRTRHAAEATRARRLDRLRDGPPTPVPLGPDPRAALGAAGGTWADLARHSRHDLLGTGRLTPADVDRLVTTLAGLLQAGAPAPAPDTPEAESETLAARRAALQAARDRDWDDAAPAGDRPRTDGT